MLLHCSHSKIARCTVNFCKRLWAWFSFFQWVGGKGALEVNKRHWFSEPTCLRTWPALLWKCGPSRAVWRNCGRLTIYIPSVGVLPDSVSDAVWKLADVRNRQGSHPVRTGCLSLDSSRSRQGQPFSEPWENRRTFWGAHRESPPSKLFFEIAGLWPHR